MIPREKRLICWIAVACLTAGLTALSIVQALRRYDALQTGWSWDLAYYNQWFWALTQGDGVLSVRPVASYAEEGPSVWKMNYLAPIRFLIVPFYMLAPDPRTLLVIQGVMFWWVVPAAFTLVFAESRSNAIALSAAFLTPLTPLFWPLVWNDFRELQLALPFVLWAVQGVRGRQTWLAVLGILGILCCRQEFAVMVASFAFLPGREPEDLSTTLRWRQATLIAGLVWLFLGFFGYLKLVVGTYAPAQFIDQFMGPKAPLGETLATSADLLFYGLGAWAVFACCAPRVALLAVPWVWGLSNGRWALRYLATDEWHHVRYTIPAVAMVLAAGLIGYARMGHGLRLRRGGLAWMALIWIVAAGCSLVGLNELTQRMSRIPRPISEQEAEHIWPWIREVKPEDGVIATYEVTAPLSSRRRLSSYLLEQNKPKGFPRLGPEFQWVFLKAGLAPSLFTEQGFTTVHAGPFLTILRRDSGPPAGVSREEPAEAPGERPRF